MPAPAVIPAPRAYINAVAVKGFVVEMWASEELCHTVLPRSMSCRTVALGAREHKRLNAARQKARK